MKTVVFAPAALDRLAELLAWTVERFGEAQAEGDAVRLARRLEALAAGEGPKARPCERLMRGVREASGLVSCREGSHYLILREGPDTLEVVEIFHERTNIEAKMEQLMGGGPVVISQREFFPSDIVPFNRGRDSRNLSIESR